MKAVGEDLGIVNLALVNSPALCLFFCCEETVDMITPDVAVLHANPIVLCKEFVRVVEAGNVGYEVTKNNAYTIVEIVTGKLEGIPPADGDFITLGAEVCNVLFRSRGAVNCGQRHTGGKHVLSVTDVGLDAGLKAVVEEAHIKTDVGLD